MSEVVYEHKPPYKRYEIQACAKYGVWVTVRWSTFRWTAMLLLPESPRNGLEYRVIDHGKDWRKGAQSDG